MGVTIHFRARLKDEHQLARAVQTARAFAASRDWPTRDIAEQHTLLPRGDEEHVWEYEGPTSGIVVFPDEWCDPLCLEFGTDLYAQDFVKTQFAGSGVHEQVVQLLDALVPYLEELVVEDEGEFWSTRDHERLAEHIEACDRALKELLKESPNARGPMRVANGRWIDLMA